MKAIHIVGFKKTGKTTLMGMLATELEALGNTVAIVKYSHHELEKPATDTTWLTKEGRTVVGLAPNEAAFFWTEHKFLPDLIPLINADFLLIEGGKSHALAPRILCLSDNPPATDSIDDLLPELAIATFGESSLPNIQHYAPEMIPDLAKLVLEKGFLLPGLDCGSCGLTNCAGLAKEIVQGKSTIEQCSATHAPLTITINNKPLALNPFVAKIVQSSITGMLGELKGFSKGSDISITFKA